MSYEDREELIKEITAQIEEVWADEKEEIFPALNDMVKYFAIWFPSSIGEGLSYSAKTDLVWIAVRRASVSLI
jgi:hypothetical protein